MALRPQASNDFLQLLDCIFQWAASTQSDDDAGCNPDIVTIVLEIFNLIVVFLKPLHTIAVGYIDGAVAIELRAAFEYFEHRSLLVLNFYAAVAALYSFASLGWSWTER
jgi:hypothetical protein